MPNGTVKFFNDKKAFGFITADEGNQEIFLPAASLTASGIPTIVAGQRVSFETQADKKGPKAIEIKLLDEPLVAVAPRPAPPARVDRKPAVTLYFNPESDLSDIALEDLRTAGLEARVIDYVATPPLPADLRKLSLLLRESDQSLVRKYDTLFLELRLDDRFISENEFWGAISEHPTLINGPVLATQSKACLVRNENDIERFLAALAPQGETSAPQAKSLSPRLLQMMAGTPVAPRPAPPPPPPVEDIKPVEKPAGRTVLKIVDRTDDEAPAPREAKPVAKAEPAPVKKAEAKKPEKPVAKKAAAKPAPKAKAPAKKPAAKPVKKATKR